jgi:hypothetical protein
VPAGQSVSLFPGAPANCIDGLQMEVSFTVNMSSSGWCAVRLLASTDGAEFTDVGVCTVAAGSNETYMAGVDLPGADYNVTNVQYTGVSLSRV